MMRAIAGKKLSGLSIYGLGDLTIRVMMKAVLSEHQHLISHDSRH